MKKTYAIVFLLVATELIGFGLIIPILPQISQQFTSSGILIGILLASYSIAQFFAAPVLGQLSDKFGRKPILIISKFGTILSYILLAYSNTYILLLASRLLDGLTGGNIAVARAYLSDVSSEENRSKAMAIVGIGFATGFIIGPAIGGFCYQLSNDFSIAGFVGAGLSLVSLIITSIGISEPKIKISTKKRLSIFTTIKKYSNQIIIILISYGVVMMVFSGFETSFSVYTNARFGLDESQNSFLFFLIGIAAFFVQGSLMKISIQPFRRAAIITMGSISIGLILTNIIPGMWLSLSALVLLVFGIGIANTHFPAELTRLANNQTGTILGIYESIGSISRIIGPLLVYFLMYEKISSLYIILGSLMGIYLIIYFAIQKT